MLRKIGLLLIAGGGPVAIRVAESIYVHRVEDRLLDVFDRLVTLAGAIA